MEPRVKLLPLMERAGVPTVPTFLRRGPAPVSSKVATVCSMQPNNVGKNLHAFIFRQNFSFHAAVTTRLRRARA